MWSLHLLYWKACALSSCDVIPNSESDPEMPQSDTAEQPTAPLDTGSHASMKTIKVKQLGLSSLAN